MTGIVTAFDAATGKQIWQKPGSTHAADVHQRTPSRRSSIAGW